jgi:hypothetical protein
MTDITIDFGARKLAEQLKKYPDKLSGIQSYSGTGKIPYGGRVKGSFFGQPAEEMNLWRDKPQAKRVLDISGKLKNWKPISDFIDEVMNTEY